MSILREKNSVCGKTRMRVSVGAALMAASLLFVSCPREVGLGAAVDTQKPQISILKPEADSVVKDVIKLSGKASDETSLESVIVKFKSTESSFSKTYPATFDAKAGTWSLSIDTEDATNGLPDSKYEITVTAKDKSGKTSNAARSFQIDNAAPTILVTKPSTFGGNDTVLFYKQIDICGEAWDASEITDVKIGLYKDDGTLIIEKSLTESQIKKNIDVDGTTTWSSLFYETDVRDKLTYDNTVNKMSEPIYFYVTATDKAGNTSKYFYHKSDMYSLLKQKKNDVNDELLFPKITQIGHLDQGRSAMTVTGSNSTSGDTISVDVSQADLSATKHEAFTSSLAGVSYPHLKFTTVSTANINWTNIPEVPEGASEEEQYPAIGVNNDIYATIQPVSDGSAVDLDSLTVWFVDSTGSFKKYTHKDNADKIVTTRVGEAVNVTIKTNGEGLAGKYTLYLAGKTNSGTLIGQDFELNTARPDNGGQVKLSFVATSIVFPTFNLLINNSELSDRKINDVWYFTKDDKLQLKAVATGLLPDTKVKITYGDNRDVIQVPGNPGQTIPDGNGFTDVKRSANECSFSYEFDKSKFTDGLACRIEVTAGEGSVIKTEQLMVQKDDTGPTLSIITPTGTQSNAQLIVEGRCLEAVGCGVDTAEYQIDGGAWTAFTTAEYNANTGVWQTTLNFGTEGEKTLKIRATDKLGNSSETPAGSFIYDTANPAITFDPAVPAYYKESDKPSITIKGKATDNFGIASFTVKVDNESPVDVPVTNKEWSLNYDIGGTTPELSEGTHKLTFTATDNAGKITVETREFTVDTVKPVIKGRNFYKEFGTPNEALNTETVWFTDSNISINVNTVEATSGIDKVQYKFDSDANWSDVSNPSATSFVEKNLDDGEHKVYLQAIDHAGNVSDTATYTFKVDTAPSVLTVGELTGTNMYFKSAEAIYFTDSPLTLTGTVQDDNGLDANEAIVVKVGSEKHVVKANGVTGDSKTGATWSVTIPVTDLSETGPKQITVQAKDAKGNVCTSDTTYLAQKDTTGPVVSITAPAANDQFNTQTVTVKGTCSDNGAGVNDTETGKKLSYSIDGGSNWIEFTPAQFTGSNWQADIDFGSAEGDKTFRVRVSDKLGNKTETADVSFIYDTAEPAISFTADVKDYYNAGNKPSITISGKAEDNYGIKDNKIVVAIDSKTPENLSLTSGSWTLTKSIGEGTPDLSEGNHTVTFSVTDKAGKPYSITKTFFVDTGKPVIKSSNFFTDAGDRKTDTIWFTDKFVTLNIRVEDGTITSGVGKVQYKFDSEADWSEVPNPAVSNTINKEFTDGGHSLQVKVTDKAGNESVVETFSFNVDTTPPAFTDLTFEAVNPAKEYEKDEIHYVTGEVKISGKVTDSNGFDATEPLVAKYGSSTIPLTPAVADGSWYINITGDKFSESATTTVTIEAKDASGKKTSTSYKVRKDVSYPALSVTPELTDGKKITDLNKRTFAFTITDTGAGIKSVQSVLNGETKTETAEFNIVFDEGMSQSLSIVVEDQLGNTHTYAYTGINVDAAPPVLSDITPQPTYLKEGDVYKFGGTAADNVGGKASDNIGLGEVRVTAKRDNVTITTPNMDGYWYKNALTGTGPIALNIPDFIASGTAADLNGTWSFTIEVFDSADNVASEKREFTVDVSKPAAPTVNDYPGKVLLTDSSSPYQFRGTDSDVGTGIAKVQYCTTNSATDSDWVDVTGTNSWVEGISIASEGEGTMYFRAIDYAGNVSDVTAQAYIFDATAPSLDDLTCSESSDFTNKSFSITATAWDGWKLDTSAPVTMTQRHTGINNGAPLTVTVPAGTSSGTHGTGVVDTWVFTGLPVNASGTAQADLVSGKYTFEVTAKDAAGKKTTKSIVVTVDNANPETPVIEAPNDTQINTNAVFGETYQFRGTARDVTGGSGLKQIQYQFTTTEVEPTEWTNVSVADGPWSFSKNLKEGQTSDIAAGNLAEGRWYLWVRAEDKAGNISAVAKRMFDIDLKTPTVSVTEPEDITKTTYVKDSITIKGTATDTNGLKATDAVKVTVGGGTPQYATVTGDNWEITLPNTNFTKDTQLTATITAIDAVGKEASISVPFYFDTTGPVVEINVPQSLVAVDQASYEIKGTVSDAGIGKIKRVYYTLGDTLPTTATETRADIAADGRSWTQTISLSGEGTKKLNILAEDELGNLNTVKTVEFYYDLAAPDITETNIGDSGLSTNAGFTLSGTASDTNQLSATRPVQIQASTTTNVLTPGVSGSSWTQSYVVGTANSSQTNYIPDGTTLFTIIAEDITGKTTRITRTVTVDTTPPSVSLNAGDGFENPLVEKDTSPYNLLTVQASDTGAGATGLAGVYYQIADSKPEFKEATESSWTSMAQGTNGWIANVNFADITQDGEVKAWVAAKDRVGNRFVFDTAITTWVDILKPVLTVTGDDFTGGSDVTLTITSTDTNPDKPTVAVTLPGGTASTVTVEASLTETNASYKKYTAVIPFSETNDLTADGTYTITINGKDTKGRDADPVTHEILRDKTAPAVELTSYNTEATYQSLKTVTLTGKVTDPNLTTVTAQLSGQPATDIRSLLGADGSFEWKQYDLIDDTYTITVVAKDKANNTTTVKTKDIIIDTTAPDSTFAYETDQVSYKLYDTTGTALSGDALTAGTTYLAKTKFTLKGVIAEDNFDSAVLNIKKDNTVQPSKTITSSGAWSYVQDRVDATYEYMLTVIDKAGNRFDKSLTVVVDTTAPDVTIITPAEGESFLNKPITIRGTITDDGAGVRELLYSQNGNTPSLPVNIAGSSWTKEIDFASEGIFALKVRASDLLGNTSTIITRNFSYDLYDPQLTETRIGDSGLTTNAAFGFSGKAWDSNALDEITVTDGVTTWSNKSGDGKVQAITLDAAAGKCATEAEVASDNWSIDFVVGAYTGQKPATWIADGTTTYTITVKDIAGKSRSYNRTVTVDTTKPTITKETGDGFSKTLVEHDGSPFSWLTVHATDTGAGATGLAGVYYQIASATPEFTDSTESEWSAMAQGTNGWTVNVDFSAITADGTVKVYVAAKDQAGNRAIYDGYFSTYVDMTKPVLSLESGSGFTDAKADVELVVRVTDSNPRAPTVLIKDTANNEITDPGVSIEEIQENATSTYKEYTITVPFKTNSTKYPTDGTYTVYIDGTDQQGRQADAITHKILRDTSAPTVTLSTYNTVETFISNGTLTVQGTVTDGNLIKVEAWLVKDGADQPVQDITNELDDSGNFIWKQYDLTEGVYYVHVKGTDKAGLTGEAVSKKITVDKTASVTDFSRGPAPGEYGGIITWTAGATYNQKEGYTLIGEIDEDNLSSVQMKVKKDGTEIGNWTFTENWTSFDPEIDPWGYDESVQMFEVPKTVSSSADDGIYIYELTVIDKAGNREEKAVTVVVDTTAPTVSITTPGDGEFTVESSMTMRGTLIDDGSGADTLYYTLDGNDPDPATTTTTADINGSTWTKTINFTDEGTFTLKVMATDVLGNKTSVISRNFSYDLYDPGIVETTVGDSGLTTNANFSFGGKAWDSNQISEITVTDGTTTWSSTAGDVVIDTSVDSKKNSAANVSANNWHIDFVVGPYTGSKPATWVADGTIPFTVKITDIAGKSRSFNRTVTVDTTVPSITKEAGDGFAAGSQVIELDVSPYNRLTMHASDSGTGLDGVYYKLADSKPDFTSATESSWTSMAQGMAGWTANVDFSGVTADGTVKAWVAAKDRVGNRTVFDSAITAEIDLQKPVITVTGNDFSDGENVILTIKVEDTNPEDPEIAIKMPDGNISSTSVTASKLDQQATYTTYLATIPFKDNGNDLTQSGTYEITVSGEDKNDRAAESKTHRILLDIQAPVITLTSYTEKTYLGSNSVTVAGTVTDLNLTSVTAQLTGKEQTDITSLLDQDGSFTWKQYDLSDGPYIATVVASDRANNTSTEHTAEIVIDTTSPASTFAYETTQASDKLYDRTGVVLSDETLTAGTTYLAKTAFKLKGVITETNFKTAILSIKKDNVSQTPKTITAAGAWEYEQLADADHSNDGTYIYTLTLIDQANNRFEQSVTVIVDTTSPMLIVTTPAASEKLTTNKKKFAGNVSDMGAGIKEVTYKLTNGTDEISSGNAVVTGASWAIDGADNTGIDLQREGTLVIEVKATDLLEQTTTETTTFYFDQGAPTLTETGVGVSGLTTNAAFTLTGTASDTNALTGVGANGVAVGAISVYTGSGVSKVDYGPVDVAAPVAPATAGIWSLTMTPGTGTGELADGVYTFYITATDVSSRETTVQRTVVVDTQTPTINKVSGNSAFITDTPSYGWYDKGTLSLGAVVTDNDGGSGVASVEYAVISNPTAAPAASDWQNAQYEGKDITWKSMTRGAASFTAKAEVADGDNYIVICASDTAGNKTYTVQEFAKIDTCEPALVGGYEEQACTTPVLTKVTNAKAPISVYIKTEDLDADEINEGSKVDSVVAKIGNKNFATDPIIATYVDENLYLLLLSADKLDEAGSSDNSQKTVYIQITDNAGNKSSATSLFTLQFDTVGPDIEFMTPAMATVNKEISITGKANDLQGLQSVKLFYLWNDTDMDNMTQIGDTKTGKDAGNWSFTFDTTAVLNHVLANGEQADLTLIARATDSAGNVNTESLTVKVDQEEDIPTVTIAQPETLAGMTTSAPVWLKGNNKITGTISDDDGITGLEMSTDGTNWTNIPVSGGYFQAQLPIDGSYTVQFRVTDTAGGVFTAGNTGLTALKLQDNKSPASKSPDGKLYLKVDTKNPQMLVTQYAFDGTSTTASDWKTGLLADTTFGGTDHTEFTLKQYVYDVNGINKVEVSVDDGAFALATEKTADTTVDGGNTYTAWTYTVNQIASLETSLNHTLKVRVTDNADMTNEVSATFKVDNDEPTVTLGSHSEEERVRGTLFVSGTTQDAPLYGPATTMLYKVTKTAATPADWTTTLTTSTDYGAHVVSGNLASWRIYFDDDLNNMDGYTHDRALKKILVQLDSSLEIATTGNHIGAVVWKNSGSGHNAGDLYTPLTMMYLHLKATDAYGNEANFVRALELDPQGDIPSISIAYPSITGYGWKNGSNVVYTTAKLPEVGDSYYTDIANMTTAAGTVSSINRDAKTITCGGTTYSSYGGETVQGGIVRVQGTADGQNAIKAIYMQIDPAYNKATGFNWKADGSAIMPNGAALNTKYTIVPFFEGSTQYGIKIGDSVSWSTSLNRNSEFNGASGVQSHIGIRLYAVDTKNNVNPLNIADDIIVTIDSDSPQVGSSEELYLYQYSDNGTVVASQKYEDDMWLTGEWWIQGSVEDASGIEPTLVNVQKQDGSSFVDYSFTKTSATWASSNTSGYIVKFKIGSADDGEFGKLVYQISATDKDTGNAKSVTKQISINFDNAAPVLAVSGHEDYNINPAVAQNNGFYTLGSSISETGNSTDSQSGFKRLALYFVRPGATAGTGTLYDTYFLKNSSNNNMQLTSLTEAEGLHWKSIQVIRDPENLSSLTLNGTNANIHKGGLVKVGGTNYVITSVNGSAITIDGSPAVADPSTRKEDASFAMGALIIDHLLTEGNGTAANLVDGYYTDVVNDDGDNIVEKVTTQGYTTFWEANICSRNIPDGAIEIHYVAFDKAGNYASDVVTGTVANNAPRLAGVMYGTDDDGSGTVEDDEMKSDLFAISTSTTGTREGYINSSLTTSYLLGTKGSVSVLKIKGATTVKPEIVGGNGTLGYSWSVTKKGETTPYYSRGYQALAVTGTDYSATGAAAEIQDTAINLSVVDLLSKDANAKTLVDGSNQLFSFTIWDSTAGMTAGTNSQRATIEMVADLELRDTTAPNAYIKPFYWKSKSDNSVYSKIENGKSVLMGHIDLGSDLGTINSGVTAINDADDKVSGSIVIEGTAQDNVLLKDIYVRVYSSSGNEVFTFTGANKVTSGELNNFYQVAHNNNGTWVSTGSNLSNGWTFSVDPESESFSQEEGHTIAWKLVLNTEKISNVARSNVQLAVRARDQGQPALNSGSISYTQNTSAAVSDSTSKTSGDTTATQTNYNQFDVVPYITGVSTRLSSLKKNNPTVYNRTSLGKYSIGADETVIFTGYNLTGASVKYINGYNQQGTATYGTGTTTAKTANDVNDYYKNLGTSFVSWQVPTAARSGDIQLTVNSIPSLNNLNNNNAKGAAVDENEYPVTLTTANYDVYAYNRQPNGDNNLNLTDDVFFDFWSINTKAAVARDEGMIDEPVMKINPSDGSIGLAFASGADTFCMPNGKGSSYIQWSTNYANFSTIALTYDNSGNAYGIAVGLDTNSGDGGYAGRMALMTSLWSRSDWATSTADNFYGGNKMRLESIGLPRNAYAFGKQKADYQIDTRRFSSSSLAVSEHNGTRGFYLAYYDRLTGQIRFRSGSTNATTKDGLDNYNNTGARYFGQFYDNYGQSNGGTNGGYLGNGNINYNGEADNNWAEHRCFEARTGAYSLIAGAESDQNSTSSTTGFTAGNYVALDVIPGSDNVDNDTVVVVFYDGSDLWYVTRKGGVGSDNNVKKGSTSGNWSQPVMIFEGNGQNCTIKAGPDGSVHIACFDQGEGSLLYAYLPTATSTDSIKTATIDGYGIAGSNISIDVVKEGSSYIPYLSYYVPSIRKVKMAYLADASKLTSTVEGALDGSDDNDSYTGVWECAIIPTASSVNDDNTSIGFYKNDSGVAQNIKSNLSSSATGTSGNCNGNGTANPAIAYATTVNTSGYIEVVQKK